MKDTLHRLFAGSERSSRVKKNILASFFTKGVSVLISLALVPLTIDYVSSELYGVWLTLSSIILWVGFFDIGFNLGLKNKLAEAIAKENYELGKSLVSTTYVLMFIIFVPLCSILLLIIPYINFPALLNVDAKFATDILKSMYIIVICFGANMIMGVLSAVVAAFQMTALSGVFNTVSNFFSLITIIILIKTSSPSLQLLALAISIIPPIVLFLSSILLFRSKFKKVSPSLKAYNREHINDLFSLGGKFFIIKIQIVVLYQMTNVLISNLSDPNTVTIYNIAYKYLSFLLMGFTIIIDPLWPAFTDAYTKNDYSWMASVYNKMTKVYIAVFFCFVFFVVISPFVYNIWIGDKVHVGWKMTISVAIYLLILSWSQLQVMLINGTGKVKLQTYVTLFGLFVHLPLSFFLGQWFNGLGVVYSMCIINAVYAFFFTIQIRRIINRKANGIWIQ